MKSSALGYALVLPLISLGLILSDANGAGQTAIDNSYATADAGTKEFGPLAKALSIQSETPYSSKEGRFSITLPPTFPTFQHKQQTQTTAVGDIELHTFLAESSQGACIVGYSDFPPASFVERSAQKMLEDGRDGALGNIKATLEKQESGTVQGHESLTVYGKGGPVEKPIYVRFKFVLVRPRAYQIGYLSYDRANLDKPGIQAFFKSFRLED